MRILVCAKEVPSRDTRYTIGSNSKWIQEENVSFEMSECDEYALEEALKLKEKHGGEVVIITVGSSRAERVMRKGLAMGADRGILVVDEGKRLNTPGRIARAISAAVLAESFDLILTGTQSDDLGFAQTGLMLAENLNLPHASLVMEVAPDQEKGKITILREMESGRFQRLELQMPCLLTIQAGISSIRYPSLKGIMQAKKKEIAKLKIEDLSTNFDSLPVFEVLEIYERKEERKAELLEGNTEEVVSKLVEKLKKEVRVL
jgi:electron transfer flavoprotein beta subunit